MDNWRVVEGEYSRKVFQEYSSAITYSMVSEDEDLKERLFDKLFQWADSDALQLQPFAIRGTPTSDYYLNVKERGQTKMVKT